jgi:hypothetical protein
MAKIAASQSGQDWKFVYNYYKKKGVPQPLVLQARKAWKEYLETRERKSQGQDVPAVD